MQIIIFATLLTLLMTLLYGCVRNFHFNRKFAKILIAYYLLVFLLVTAISIYQAI